MASFIYRNNDISVIHARGRSRACSPEKICKNGAIWCILMYILIRKITNILCKKINIIATPLNVISYLDPCEILKTCHN